MEKNVNRVVLCILDGWGYNTNQKNNAINLANTPTWDNLIANSPNTLIATDGLAVGLPDKQMGNSEVGHTNIGAGRIVYQDFPKITKAFAENQVANQEPIIKAIHNAKTHNSAIHIMGLCSPGGIHSHLNHMIQSIEIFAKQNLPVMVHLFTDGRDTPPQSASEFIQAIENLTQQYNNVKIATISGRYYAMDRDKRWDRIELAYKAIVSAQGLSCDSPQQALTNSYAEQQTTPSDEFIKPTVLKDYQGMKDQDIVFTINFRADRVRELLIALLDPNFSDFTREKVIKFSYALGMVNYSIELNQLQDTLFPSTNLVNTLGEIVANNGLNQLRAAETEKYPHVTFFFNGGQENTFVNEDRIMIPSPKVATYDLKPEMSAFELKDKLVEAINSDKYSLIIVNFANGDMVGHTGVLPSAIKAVEAIDSCLKDISQAVKQHNYTLLITADHGNAENMWDDKNNAPHTQHTTNKVPLVIFNPPSNIKINQLEQGKLSDIAPTILNIMGLPVPQEMTGNNLVKNN